MSTTGIEIGLNLRRHTPLLVLAAIGAALFAAVAVSAARFENTLGEASLVSGYSLLTVTVLLALFNARKRLPMVPLIRVRLWTLAHAVGGVLALALYWLHSGLAWPSGLHQQALAALFYAVTGSGLVGLMLQQVYPRRLTQTGVEVIFERIPEEVASLRERAEAVVLSCTEEQHSDTLARFYLETFHWFFRRPRFLLSHLWGGQRAAFWVARQLATARRYLGASEEPFLDRLRELAYAKTRIDLHYAMQGMLRLWLMAHVPLAAALITLTAWHLLLVNIYAL